MSVSTSAGAVRTIPVSAESAQSFIGSVGVSTHIDSGLSVWMDAPKVVAELSYLGVKNVRDGTPYSWALPEYEDLANIGVKFDLSQENPTAAALTTIGSAQDVQRADALQLAAPGSVETLEGANEYNINSYNLDGVNSFGDLEWGVADDQNLQAAVAADPVLSGVGVVAASTADVASAPDVGAYVTDSNWHAYGGVGQQLAGSIAAGTAAAKASAPDAPVYITEAGVSSAGYAAASWGSADAFTQGIIDTNAILDGFKDGAAKTFLYDLMDDTTNTPLENDFGLFNADGTPKPAAQDVSHLLSILSGGAGDVAPGTLSYGISGLPGTASSMLLEKGDGTFDIVLWNGGATLYDGGGDVTPPASDVTLTFASAQQSVSVFDPVSGLSPVQTSTNAGAVSVSLSADPLVVQIAPQAAAVPAVSILPAPVTIGAGPDDLALQVSEDAWEGDARFTVAVDGAQIGGVQMASAPHAAGQSQTFDVDGTFAPGPHQVTVDFLNDAYGGSPSMDRNLYVTGASIDGSPVAGAALNEYSSGPQSFAFEGAGASAAPDTLTLSLSEDAWEGDAQCIVTVDGRSVGGPLTVTALHGQGQTQTFNLAGDWGDGPHTVGVRFINDAYGGSPSMDRNLYVDGVAFDGQASPTPPAALYTDGEADFAVRASTLTLHLSEDAWQGDAMFSVAVDGKTVGAPQSVTALRSAGAAEDFAFSAALSPGTHDVAVSFLNDAYGGSPLKDRNLYVNGVDVNGVAQSGASAALFVDGTTHFTVHA